MSQVKVPTSLQLENTDRNIANSREVIIIDSDDSAPTVREGWCGGSLVVEIVEEQPARSRSTTKPRPAHKEVIVLSSSDNSEGENSTTAMLNRKRPLDSPSHDGSIPDKTMRLNDGSRTSSPIPQARGSPRPLPYWRRNTSSVAGGPFGRRIRQNPGRIVPNSKELLRRSLNSTCTSPSHSSSSENTTPPRQGTTAAVPTTKPITPPNTTTPVRPTTLRRPSTPPHHEIYGHAVNPERVEEWLVSSNSRDLLADVCITPPCPTASQHGSHLERTDDRVSKSNICTTSHKLNSSAKTAQDGGDLTAHTLSNDTSIKQKSPTSFLLKKKKFKTSMNSLGKNRDSHHVTPASSSDTTPPLSPLRTKKSGLSTASSETGYSSQLSMSAKDNTGKSSGSKGRPFFHSGRKLTFKEIESSLSTYTIPKLYTRGDCSPHENKPSISHSTNNSHPLSTSSPTPQLERNLFTASQKVQSTTTLSGGKGSSSTHAKKRKHSLQPLPKVCESSQLSSYSSESSDGGAVGGHCSKRHHHHHHHKVSKRSRLLSSESESSSHQRHSKHKTSTHLQSPVSPMLSHSSITSPPAKRRKIDDPLPIRTLFRPDDTFEKKKLSEKAASNDGESTLKSPHSHHHGPSSSKTQRRHTIDATHSRTSSHHRGGYLQPFSFFPHNASGNNTPHKSPTIKSPMTMKSSSEIDREKSPNSKRRFSAGDAITGSKKQRSSVGSSDEVPTSLNWLIAKQSPHLKSNKNDRRKSTNLFPNDYPSSQSSTSQQRPDQDSPAHKHERLPVVEKSSTRVNDHVESLTPSKHRDKLKKHHKKDKEKRLSSGTHFDDVYQKSSSHKRHSEHSKGSHLQRNHKTTSFSTYSESTPRDMNSIGSVKKVQSSVSTGTTFNDDTPHTLQGENNSSLHHHSKDASSSLLRHDNQPLSDVQFSPVSPPTVPLNDTRTNTNSNPSHVNNQNNTTVVSMCTNHQDRQQPSVTSNQPQYDLKHNDMNSSNHLFQDQCINEISTHDPSMVESELFSPQNFAIEHCRDSNHAGPSCRISTNIVPRYISRKTLSSTTSSSFCNTTVFSTASNPPISLQLYGCCLSSDLTKSCEFNKYSQGHLDNFAESFDKGGYNIYNYLHVLERLLAQGSHIPSHRLLQMLDIVLSNTDDQFLKRMHMLLFHDLSIRKDVVVDRRKVWELMESCLGKLHTIPDHLPSTIVINYFLNMFLKDLNCHCSEPNNSLIERVLSLQSHYSHIRKLLDLVFTLPRDQSSILSGTSLLDVMLSLVCLPLLSCTELDRKDAALKLARDMSVRLNGLPSIDARCQLLELIPSNYLREKIIDLYLDREFVLLPAMTAQSVFTDSTLSLTKISRIHFRRTPYHRDGTPHSLTFFLRLLCMLLQSHLHTLKGEPLVLFLTPLDCSQFETNTVSPTTSDEIQQGLSSMNRSVCGLIESLMSSEIFFAEVTAPDNWYHFELLMSITSSLLL